MKFNEKIVLLRKQKGLTQEDVAFQLGLSRQALSKWESGNCEPDFKKLKELAKMYDVSLDYLLDDDFEKKIEDADKNREETSYKVYKNQVIIYRNPWFIVLIISLLIFIALILVATFADFSEFYSGDELGFVGFLKCWTLEIVILKIVMLGFLFLSIFSLVKIILNERINKDES